PGTLVPEYPRLAAGVVRAQGMPVAAVVAESTYAAADGVDRLAVEYEPLDGVSDPDGALTPGAPQVVPVSRDNRALTVAWRQGDPDRAFRDAAHRVSLTVQQQRLCGVPMEPRGALARWDPDTGELTVWTSTQAPFRIRSSLADPPAPGREPRGDGGRDAPESRALPAGILSGGARRYRVGRRVHDDPARGRVPRRGPSGGRVPDRAARR